MAKLKEISDKGCGFLYGSGGKRKDLQEGLKWIRMAAELGYAEAQYELGGCYYNGTGVEEDGTEAVNWYRKAAEQGNTDAQNKLGE